MESATAWLAILSAAVAVLSAVVGLAGAYLRWYTHAQIAEAVEQLRN